MSTPDTLQVSEIFASLQGEGPFAGQPAVFLRLSGCVQPFCPWCDTPQALRPDSGTSLNPESVLQTILGYAPKLVVITGGEPFLQWDVLRPLVLRLEQSGRFVQFETSGRAGIPVDVRGAVVCSPKPLHAPSLTAEAVRLVHAFKFVIDETVTPVLAFIAHHGISPDVVWLMPLGSTREQQTRRMETVWNHCLRHGFNFGPRLHILTFDDQRGV